MYFSAEIPLCRAPRPFNLSCRFFSPHAYEWTKYMMNWPDSTDNTIEIIDALEYNIKMLTRHQCDFQYLDVESEHLNKKKEGSIYKALISHSLEALPPPSISYFTRGQAGHARAPRKWRTSAHGYVRSRARNLHVNCPYVSRALSVYREALRRARVYILRWGSVREHFYYIWVGALLSGCLCQALSFASFSVSPLTLGTIHAILFYFYRIV